VIKQAAVLQQTAELLLARKAELLEILIGSIRENTGSSELDVRPFATKSLDALLDGCCRQTLQEFLTDEARAAVEAARAGVGFDVLAAAALSLTRVSHRLLLETALDRAELAACLGALSDLAAHRAIALLQAQQEESGRRLIDAEEQAAQARERARALARANAALRLSEARSQRRAEQIALLGSVMQRVASVVEPERLMQEAAETIRSRMGHTYVAVVVLDHDGVLIGRWAGRSGLNRRSSGRAQGPARGIIGRALRKKSPQVAGDVSHDPDYHADVPGTRSELVVPLIDEGQAMGAIDFQSAQPAAFELEDVVAAEAIAEFLVIALRNARLVASLRGAG